VAAQILARNSAHHDRLFVSTILSRAHPASFPKQAYGLWTFFTPIITVQPAIESRQIEPLAAGHLLEVMLK